MEKKLKNVLVAATSYIEANDLYDDYRFRVKQMKQDDFDTLQRFADSVRRRSRTREALKNAMCEYVGFCYTQKIRP